MGERETQKGTDRETGKFTDRERHTHTHRLIGTPTLARDHGLRGKEKAGGKTMRSPDTQTERLEVIDNNRKDAVKKSVAHKNGRPVQD